MRPPAKEAEATSTEEDLTLVSTLADLLECPVCMEDMSRLRRIKILACSNDHWICAGCAEHSQVSTCPICREDFRQNPPRRCLNTEKIARSFAKARAEQGQISVV